MKFSTPIGPVSHSRPAAALTTATLAGAAQKGQVDLFLANASYYLDMLGHIVLAWIWLEQALVARRSDAVDAYYQGKLSACRYFFRYELPRAQRCAELLRRLDDTTLNMPAEAF